MIKTLGYAVKGPNLDFENFQFERREPGVKDVLIEILYCGICHSDIHQVKNEWGNSIYPMVPGHEIVGRVIRVGKKVKRFKVGDIAGVGCFVDSCRTCQNCKDGLEQYCDGHVAFTYNAYEKDKKTPTYGGYSSHIVADEDYTLKVNSKLPLASVAPLLCAGITTYSPLNHFKVSRGMRVGIVGLGGLGHMGTKIAAAMGAKVTVFSTSNAKEKDARRFGASNFVVTSDPKNLASLGNHYDLILDTVSASHDYNTYLAMLRRDGVMVVVGVPEQPCSIHATSLIFKRKSLAGSLIGGIAETQEMLDFCAKKKIVSDIELIGVQDVASAYERTIKGQVRYRFVIDMKTLK